MAKRQDFFFVELSSELQTLTALGPQSLAWYPFRNSGRNPVRSCQTADMLDEVFGFNKSSLSKEFCLNWKIPISRTGDLYQLTRGNFQHIVKIAEVCIVRGFEKLLLFSFFLSNILSH